MINRQISSLLQTNTKKDQAAAIRKTAKFLKKKMTDEQVAQLSEHLSFPKMAANPSVNYEQVLAQKNVSRDDPNTKFIRKGKVGDWRHYMSDELSRRFDEWTEHNLKGTGLKFVTDDFEDWAFPRAIFSFLSPLLPLLLLFRFLLYLSSTMGRVIGYYDWLSQDESIRVLALFVNVNWGKI